VKLLASPSATLLLAVALAAGLHPASPLRRWAEAAPVLMPALALLLVLSLAARASRGLGIALVSLGAAGLLATVAYDQVKGHRGTLELGPGGTTGNYEETGVRDRPVGLRPFGFTVGASSISEAGALLTFSEATGEARGRVAPARATAYKGQRFGWRAARLSGEAERLEIAVSDGSSERSVALTPGQNANVDGLEIAVEQYFADFALDSSQQPFSRSEVPRNPAAVLRVRRGSETFRVFVIRAMPGIHQVGGLRLSFSLREVEPAKVLRLGVSQEPGAWAAALAVAVAAIGAALRKGES
jgi:hypothetical protein